MRVTAQSSAARRGLLFSINLSRFFFLFDLKKPPAFGPAVE
jgi:hypothetical protein